MTNGLAMIVVDRTDREMAEVLFADMNLRGAGLAEAWSAFDESEAGTVKCALDSFGRTERAAIVFLGMIRGGEHRVPQGKRTGWRMVRGTHGVDYIRDPYGGDPLPPDYQA